MSTRPQSFWGWFWLIATFIVINLLIAITVFA